MLLSKVNLLRWVTLLFCALSIYSQGVDHGQSSLIPLLSSNPCSEGGNCGGNGSQGHVHGTLDERERVCGALQVDSATLLGGVRVTYVSRHKGTIVDFRYFYKRALHTSKGSNLRNLSVLYPTNYGSATLCDFDKLLEFSESPFVDHVLSISDVLVVSDTIPDAVPFLSRLFSRLGNGSVRCSNVSVVLQVTNRFDFCMQSYPKYYDFMRRVATVPWVQWIINNPWEAEYMKYQGVFVNSTLIRPFGYAPIRKRRQSHDSAAAAADADGDVCVYSMRSPFDGTILPEVIKQFDMLKHLLRLDYYYGGPHRLASYKCFVHVPYQASVMKMSENIAAGVVSLIPSEAFYESLAKEHNIIDVVPIIRALPNNWTQYVEFYHPKYRHLFYHFSSWTELASLVRLPKIQLDNKNLSCISKQHGLVDREEQFEKMNSFFNDQVIRSPVVSGR